MAKTDDLTHLDPAGTFWRASNTWGSWGVIARALHWTHGLIVLFLIGLGLYSAQVLTGTDFDTLMEKTRVVYMHKAWGFVAFCLAVARIAWRWVSPTPDLPADMTGIERRLAHLGHVALYVLIFAMPLSGWLAATASELQESVGATNTVSLENLFGDAIAMPIIAFFGWESGYILEMPDLFVPGDRSLSETFGTIHGLVGWLLILTVLGHVLAALKHAVINQDGVLRRMVLGR